MASIDDLKKKIDELRSEILVAIKEMINKITNGDIYKPVYLNDLSIIDTAGSTYGMVSYLQMHNIFYDENDRLRGDFLGANNSLRNGFIPGKSIEILSIEDLMNILLNLQNQNYSLIDSGDENNAQSGDENNAQSSGDYKSLLKKYLNKHKGILKSA